MKDVIRQCLPSPETESERLLVRAGADHKPVRLEAVLQLWEGVQIAYEDLDNAGYVILCGIHGTEIVVRRSDPVVRQRFTIAHELAHLTLEADMRPSLGLQCGDARTEQWCDRFAAALLMPRRALMTDLQSHSLSSLFRKLRRLPSEYQVSLQAMRIRVAELAGICSFEYQIRGVGAQVTSEVYAEGHDPSAMRDHALSLVTASGGAVGEFIQAEPDRSLLSVVGPSSGRGRTGRLVIVMNSEARSKIFVRTPGHMPEEYQTSA